LDVLLWTQNDGALVPFRFREPKAWSGFEPCDESKTGETFIRHDHNHEAPERRGFLEWMSGNISAAIGKERFMQPCSIASRFVTALSLVVLASGTAHAQYRFIRIADETGSLRFNGSPATINDAGDVTFAADTITGSGIFVGRGGPVSTVADLSDGFRFFGFSSIDGRGRVSFFAFRNDGSSGIYSGPHGETTFIDDSGPILGFGGDCHSSRSGTFTTMHAFLKNGGQSIFAGRDQATTTIADTSGDFSGFDTDPTVNARGQVAFQGNLRSGGAGIFVSDGRTLTTIADTLGEFAEFTGASAINNRGEVAFGAILKSQGGGFFRPDGIFVGSGGQLRTVVDSSGPFFNLLAFGRPVINDRGQVAFLGVLDNFQMGLFVGPDPVADRVIMVGDPLEGSTVIDLAMFRDYFNNAGQLVFTVRLADGRTEIIRADPVPGLGR
jgi:hypothetical protein